MHLKRQPSILNILACGLLAIPLLATPARAAGDDADRKVLQQIPATYPEIARQMHLNGSVLMRVSVRPDGKVEDVEVVGGHPMFRVSAMEAVRRWRYAPATESSVVNVRINFTMP